MGFSPLDAEPCLYINSSGCIMITYVQDIGIGAPTKKEANDVFDQLKSSFKMENRGDFSESMWLGCRVRIGEYKTTLDQESYVDKALQAFGLEDIPGALTPMASNWHLTA